MAYRKIEVLVTPSGVDTTQQLLDLQSALRHCVSKVIVSPRFEGCFGGPTMTTVDVTVPKGMGIKDDR